MLSSLNINDVVLIDKLTLDFSGGLSVFTGETGAGKSILLDSLALALGERAEASLVRSGEDNLKVIASFNVDKNHKSREILREVDIEIENDEIILKRIVSKDGKSKAFINDTPTTLAVIKRLAQTLVEIHGQFMTHGLLDNKTHINVLDEYGNYNLNPLKTAFQNYNMARESYENAVADFEKLKSDEEYLKHNLHELIAFKIKENEYEELGEKIALGANSEKICQGLNNAYQALNNHDITSNLRVARGALERIEDITMAKYKPFTDTIERLEIDIKEMLLDIGNELNNQDLDTMTLDEMQERHFAFKSLAKKHGIQPEELYGYIAVLKEQVEKIDLGADFITKQRQRVEATRLDYLEKAREITAKRRQMATDLDRAVMAEFPALKLSSAKFKTEITTIDEIRENGMDNVKFKVVTNAGADFDDLSKIASGGELSRFMLALKVILMGGADTIIFDEVDAGIGGATASAVGARLKRLGKQKQVLVVTHSPQVASFGATHFKVKKYEKGMQTFTTVEKLSNSERIDEIARMLAGKNITEASKNAAEQLVNDNERA